MLLFQVAIHDEFSSMESDDEDGDVSIECSLPDSSPRSAFQSILQKSSLANSLRIVFEELSNNGNLKIVSISIFITKLKYISIIVVLLKFNI